MRYSSVFILLSLLAIPVSAIDIGPMTVAMEPTVDFLARTVINNSETPKVYEIGTMKVTNPTAEGEQMSMEAGEFLFTPKRFILHPKQHQNVKFYYKGYADNLERYYRVIFTESPVALVDDSTEQTRKGALDIKLELQSVLVVRPRQIHFDYQLNVNKKTIRNTGNTYFEFMVKKTCEQQDRDAESKYLLPGETYYNQKIGKSGSQTFIIYQSRFLQLGSECS